MLLAVVANGECESSLFRGLLTYNGVFVCSPVQLPHVVACCRSSHFAYKCKLLRHLLL